MRNYCRSKINEIRGESADTELLQNSVIDLSPNDIVIWVTYNNTGIGARVFQRGIYQVVTQRGNGYEVRSFDSSSGLAYGVERWLPSHQFIPYEYAMGK